MRNTQLKGDIATTQAIATFTRMGFDVSVPLTESAAYDLVVDVDNVLKRVQVKYSSESDVDLRHIHSNSTGYIIRKAGKNIYDWIYIYRPTGEEYLIKKCPHSRRSIRPTEKQRIY